MVVGACITTRSRPLLARQFVEISKAKVEALLHAFVKLVEFSGASGGNWTNLGASGLRASRVLGFSHL